ncbi:Hypothetical predicted protein [Mytilus galloprovincialis]|uniref:Reverse transcriptase domain-containing protein n=2 Tax=Mytilus TaxID=6548 RepID=A0A8B6FIV4_MYTGA|nr:Hypothetical predicted protein [Mytilus galloprovincialis]
MHDNADSFQDIPHDNFVQFFKKLNKSDDNCSSFHKTIMEHFQQLKDNIDNDPSNNILDVDITTDEIIKSIKALKNGKSTAMDLVSNEMLKYGGQAILNPLTKLFNFILNIGQFPSKWNDSFLVLLHKSGSKMDPSNYRGI